MVDLSRTRAEAIKAGGKKYFTNRACFKGHLSYRYVASGMCAQCASEQAKKNWSEGKHSASKNRQITVRLWNSSQKAKIAKQRWKDKNPKRAWAVFATGAAKMRAVLKNLEFDLTSDYVESITPDRCPIFNEPFLFVGNKVMKPFSASLDRLDSSKGYVKENVVVISMKANSIKNAYGSEEVLAVGTWLQQQGF